MMESLLSWNTMWYVLVVLYVPACIGLIAIVLLQKGKGTGFAGAFGAGAGPGSETVFGPRAGQTLPVKLTYVAAIIFVVMSMSMSLIAGYVSRGRAPELAAGGDATTPTTVTTGLEDLGLGGNRQGAAGTVAPTNTAPSTTTPAAPAAAAPATSTPAPAPVTPQQ
jgi:preprotein translocase subunit SecG